MKNTNAVAQNRFERDGKVDGVGMGLLSIGDLKTVAAAMLPGRSTMVTDVLGPRQFRPG